MERTLGPIRSYTFAILLPVLAHLALGGQAEAQEGPPPREALPAESHSAEQKRDTPPALEEAAPADQKADDLKSLSLEELMEIEVGTVVSASKFRQKLSDAPATVSIITAEDIRRYGHRTLTDVLRSAGGLYTSYDRNYAYLGIRGFGRPGDYNTRVLLLVDGHRMNDAIYASAAIGTDFILDVDLIERVEVTRGPGSSLYGSNAFFGIVNIITRRAGEGARTELSAEAASAGTAKGRATYGNRSVNGSEVILSATGLSSKGKDRYFSEYDPANPIADPVRAGNSGIAENADGDRFVSAFGSYAQGGLRLSAAGVQRTKIIPTASYGTDFNDPGSYTTDQRSFVDGQYGRRTAAGTEYTVRGYADLYRFSGHYMYGGTDQPDYSSGGWYGGEARVTGRFLDIHRVVVGAEGEVQARQDQWHAGWADNRQARSWALYAQDEVAVSPIFLVYAGIRHDHSSMYGGSTNPRLSAVIKPVENGTLKLMYGTAYRAPTVYERWYQFAGPPDMLSNPDLRPERIETYELAYEHDFGRGMRASLARYSYGIRNLITQTPDALNNTSFQNVDRVDAVGTELELQKAWPGGAQGRISYAYQKAEDPATGERLTNSPKQLARLNVSAPLSGERIFLGLEEQYTGPRLTEAGQSAGGFCITNITLLGRSRTRTVEASLSVYNLLDKRYADPVETALVPLDTVLQDGRTVRVKLTYAF